MMIIPHLSTNYPRGRINRGRINKKMENNSIDIVLKQREVSRAEKIRLVLSMSLPAILAQLTSIAMQYIDAGMVGSLGAEATASIGLVSSSTWLIGGSCIGLSANGK